MIRSLNTQSAQTAAAIMRRGFSVYEAMEQLAASGYLEVRNDAHGRPLLDSFGEPVYRATQKFIPWLEGGTIL